MIPARLIERIENIVGGDGVVRDPAARRVYEADAFTLVRRRPALVVLPRTAQQVCDIVRLCNETNTPFVPRGAGTGLAGGSLTRDDAVMISLNRLRRIRRIDPRNRLAEVEAGVINLKLSRAVAEAELHFAPDPSSQQACTIGGNIATNAGGPHTLKYGVTVDHVLGLELVTPSGDPLTLGGTDECFGPDLVGLLVGSEGTLGIVTAATVRLTRLPEAVRTLLAVFDELDHATHTVRDVIAAGIIPAAMELMDRGVIAAVEAAYRVGFPLDAGAVLIVEVDGAADGIDRAAAMVLDICRANAARTTRIARDEAERALLWKSRKRAAGALGRLTTSYCTQDGVVPRSELPGLIREIAQISAKYAIRIANLLHAGDGNIHPIIMFDERDPDQVRRALDAGREILRSCIRRGGTVTGEHGIGVEKIEFLEMQYSPAEVAWMLRLRDTLNPRRLCNPDKVFPDGKACWEIHHPGKRAPV